MYSCTFTLVNIYFTDGVISENGYTTEQANAKISTYVAEAACTDKSTDAHTPIPAHVQPVTSPIDDDAVQLKETATVKPPSEAVCASDTGLTQLNTQKRALKTSSEPASHPGGSPPKKPRLDLTGTCTLIAITLPSTFCHQVGPRHSSVF
jgi:hypothetical protein